MLGAYTRLNDAGLGCPDWPGCYGHWVAPTDASAGAYKAWLEMIHRYAAGMLGLLIVFLGFSSWYFQRKKILPVLLISLVLFQAALGMWTVTLKLLPIIVMGHLLGGMTIAALLTYLYLSNNYKKLANQKKITLLTLFSSLGVIIVFIQIALGGWVSSNYAGLICPTFPTCQGSLWPLMDFGQAFNLFQHNILENTPKVTIQMTHRIGALITFSYVFILSLFILIKSSKKSLKIIGGIVLLLLFLQVSLGILNIEWLMPLPIAVLHNGVAALLLLTMVSLVWTTFGETT